ncbi:2-dehydropantoate 2-reductase family protein [Penicillium malachiteum]|uniref:2-dehydropantoate 2-reductase family protein n=1 Tax=Penicillium malachiteum TaxID=1324776 RepID=UPI00254675DA|nr:2-dehydropantoate 2-reductase family protein [Penicillium malachiteum]KAJ5725884.1 2-dehydropantoate 2-reductase family protein [Penicillium malachiteum]
MVDKAKVLIIGGGSVGTIAALNLQSGDLAEVTLVLRSNYQVVEDNGFSIESCDHGKVVSWRPSYIVNAIPAIQPGDEGYDYVVVTTKHIPNKKGHQVSQIAPSITPRRTVIVLIQNGLNIERPYLEEFPENIVLSGISMIGSEEIEPGVIKHSFHDQLTVGPFHNPNLNHAGEIAAAKKFVERYSTAGKASCLYDEAVGWNRWKKLVYNSSMNPICALTGLDAGQIRSAGDAISKLAREAMTGIYTAAKVSGYELPADIVEFMATVDRVEDHFVPSMLQDIRKGNKTEFEYLLGEPLREGQRLGVSMPILSTLYALCEAVQWRVGRERTN